MKTSFITLLFILIALTSYSQTYSDLVASSFTFLEQNKQRKFEKTYPKLFTAYVKEQVGEYQAALSAVEEGNREQAFQLLGQLVADTTLLQEIKSDKNFKPLHKDKRWGALMDNIDVLERAYHSKARTLLLEINDQDQGIRLLVLEAYRKFGKESEEAQRVRAEMRKADAISADKIQKIISKYGWLGSDKVGYFGNQVYFLAIQHVDDTLMQQKYLPIMRKAVKEGKAKPWQYAFLQDRILMNQGKPQIYGTQKVVSDDPEKSYIIPLQDPDHVDSLRAEVGLGPLKEYLEEDGLVWDVEMYKSRLPEINKMYRERFLKLQAEQRKD